MSAVSVGFHSGNTFAERLDRAIDASNRAKQVKMIELTAAKVVDAESE